MPRFNTKRSLSYVLGLLAVGVWFGVMQSQNALSGDEAISHRSREAVLTDESVQPGLRSSQLSAVAGSVQQAPAGAEALPVATPSYSANSNEVRFKASPSRALVRGPKSTLIFPEMKVQERMYQSNKVFDVSPLGRVSESITGDLTVSALTDSAVEAELNLEVVEAFLQSDAEYLKLPINATEELLVSIQRTYDRGEHTITLFGHTGQRATNETHLVFHDGVLYGTIHEVNPFRVIEYTSNGEGKVAIRELDVRQDIYGSCDAIVVSEDIDRCSTCSNCSGATRIERPAVSADQASVITAGAAPAGINHDTATYSIDLVITYLEAAADALGGVSAAEARIVAHVDTATQLLVNSQITDTAFHLLGTGFETVATGGLVRPDDPADHNTMQNLLGADISGKMYVGGGGSAWTPSGASVYEGFVFGSAVPASTGSSFPHEVCHNLGAGHSFGDGGYRNTVTDEIHYGWRFRVEGYNYRTAMSYDTSAVIATNSANSSGPRIGYLSDPDQNYAAAVDGDATITVPLGAALGFDGSAYAYMDPSLLYGGRDATFSYSDNGTPGDYTDETFSYVSGGIITNGFDGTYSTLGANNNERVDGRIEIHANHQTRASGQFVLQPAASYDSTEEMIFSVFVGDHHDTIGYALYKGGHFVTFIETEAPAYLHTFSYKIPETGLVSGADYQIVAVVDSVPVVQSQLFSLNIFEALPVAYYKLDETSGTALADSSGNGHTATLVSGILNASGAVDGAVEIDADDTNANRGLQLPNSVKDEISDAVTIMFWAFGDDSLPRQTSILTGSGFNIHLPWSNGTIFWDAGNATMDRVFFAANPEDYKGRWNHYAFTKNASTGEMKIFVNGVERVSGSGNTQSMDLSGALNFGSASAVGVNAYDGLLDEVRIYNTALGASKIQDLYNEVTVPSVYWTGTNGDGLWTTGGNWSTGAIPVAGDIVELSNGDTVELSAGVTIADNTTTNLLSGSLAIGTDASLNLPTGSVLNINGGSLTKDFSADANNVNLGAGTNSVIHLESGSLQMTGGGIPQLSTSLKADLNIRGGDLDIDVQTLIFGDLTILGDAASVSIRYLNPLAGSSINFVLDESGVSPIDVAVWASVIDSTITVDGSAYRGGAGTIPLIRSNNLLNQNASIEVTGFADLGLTVEIVQDEATHDVSLLLTDNITDSDGDGFYDWQEDIVGTDPNRPSSMPLVAASGDSNQLTLEWPTVSGRSYTIEYTDTLGGDWGIYMQDVAYTAGQDVEVSISIDPDTSSHRFYRLTISR